MLSYSVYFEIKQQKMVNTVESRCSILSYNIFSPITYCCCRFHSGRRFIWPENSAVMYPHITYFQL